MEMLQRDRNQFCYYRSIPRWQVAFMRHTRPNSLFIDPSYTDRTIKWLGPCELKGTLTIFKWTLNRPRRRKGWLPLGSLQPRRTQKSRFSIARPNGPKNLNYSTTQPRRTQNVDFSMVSDSSFYFRDGFYGPRKEENKRALIKNGPDKHPIGVIKDANFLLELRFKK